jgi:acetyl esterase/lipase
MQFILMDSIRATRQIRGSKGAVMRGKFVAFIWRGVPDRFKVGVHSRSSALGILNTIGLINRVRKNRHDGDEGVTGDPRRSFVRMRIHLSPTLFLFLAVTGLVSAEPQRIPVWPEKEAPNGDGSSGPATSTLTVHEAEQPNGAAMVICPGGGYGGLVTEGEGHGIARWLNAHGITGLVLEYRLPQGRRMVPLLDAQRAIRLARSKAKAWKIDPQRIGIIGFSAGGHLASTAATRFDEGDKGAKDPVEGFSSRPDFAVLIYPVITMGEISHGGSRGNLLGPAPSQEVMDEFSTEKQVTGRTPPTFLAHAKDDTVVSIRNSQLFAEALKAHKVEGELLELPSGGHGLNGYKGPSWDAWQAASLKWLEARGMLKGRPGGSR